MKTAQAVDDFLADLVPVSMRGKELGRMEEAAGAPSILRIDYENAAIYELRQGGRRTGVTVAFKNEACRK